MQCYYIFQFQATLSIKLCYSFKYIHISLYLLKYNSRISCTLLVSIYISKFLFTLMQCKYQQHLCYEPCIKSSSQLALVCSVVRAPLVRPVLGAPLALVCPIVRAPLALVWYKQWKVHSGCLETRRGRPH